MFLYINVCMHMHYKKAQIRIKICKGIHMCAYVCLCEVGQTCSINVSLGGLSEIIILCFRSSGDANWRGGFSSSRGT